MSGGLNLLKSRRQVLHGRVGEMLRDNLAAIAPEPEMLAHHFTQAGMTETAIEWWGKAGQRSLERSALVEAVQQFTRAVDQIAALRATPALRRQQINYQVAQIIPLVHVKGYSSPEAKTAIERARLLIEQTDALGEPPEDSLLLFRVLHGVWLANVAAFNGGVVRELAAQFLALAGKQSTTVPTMIGHRIMGTSLMFTGDLLQGRAYLDQAIALYDPAEHSRLTMGFGIDHLVAALTNRSLTLWMLGYSEAAFEDAGKALKNAREIGQAVSLFQALFYVSLTHVECGKFTEAKGLLDELVALADEKNSVQWKVGGMLGHGLLSLHTGNAADAIPPLIFAITGARSAGTTLVMPMALSYLANAYAGVSKYDDAWRCINEAMTVVETTKERWREAEVYRVAGEIALAAPERDAAKNQSYFERALAVAREQQAKSLELRAAMSMARLWRDQGKRDEAQELLAPVYGWFTEGFDTRDLKEAKALLDELAA
jgi:predicted ATPase